MGFFFFPQKQGRVEVERGNGWIDGCVDGWMEGGWRESL